MKRLFFSGLILITGLSFNTFAQSSDSTGMPGDNFDLQGALELFKQSKSLEDFEKKLNTESNGVNNLDLDGNNAIDYIRVVDKKEGDNHAVLLQIPVNSKESQDVAAIVIEKRGKSEAQLQIIGDETLYGEEILMEPIDEKETKQSLGPSILMTPTTVIFVNVWGWPCVQYMYDPFYDPWYSPYYWDYYPSWWRPWRPVYWHVYYQRVYRYHGWCHYTNVYHVPNAHVIYKSHRTRSATVRTRYAPQQVSYKGRKLNNQVANGGRIGTEKPIRPENGSIQDKRPGGRTEGLKTEPTRPNRTPITEPKTREQAPRPINSNNRGTINNGGNSGVTRPMEPVKRNPTVQPQQQPNQRQPAPAQRQPINNPQRVQPKPERQSQPVIRQSAPVRTAPASRPSNGGGKRGR
ncbi:hypothetical protein [Fluviicola taffensis]|uniref:DUF3300 domain-containing protein n=1 Tax=Fluviicola taffensis (strain DSM 16823 / NCIMB 13979 / RW262) TaxID=755732 RepID=F2ID66_FLUTR|nr:hypothetical protein [Fluviicola taffensis]AEA45481.1 hypothetical protein Fluta_3510 [Fluviicola taffensis DSM 16823]